METLLPYLVDFTEELVVVLDVTKLAICVAVLFQRPVWWRCNDEMDRIVPNGPPGASVTEVEVVVRGYLLKGVLDICNGLLVLSQLRQGSLRVIKTAKAFWEEFRVVCGSCLGWFGLR